jgi:hypothetical protein
MTLEIETLIRFSPPSPICKRKVLVIKGLSLFDPPCITLSKRYPVQAMLRVPDRRTLQGERDYAILLTLLTTGLRKAEICSLNIGDLKIYCNQAVIDVIGKGQKFRRIPLEGEDPHRHTGLPEDQWKWSRPRSSHLPDAREARSSPGEGPYREIREIS